MSDGLNLALSRSNAVARVARDRATRQKQGGFADAIVPSMSGGGVFAQARTQTRNRERYSQYHGWLYAAVHALCQEGAGQPVHVGRLVGADPREDEDERSRLLRVKSAHVARRAASQSIKAAATEMELLSVHPLLDGLKRPNPAQNRWQFTYSFIANLNITGWSFIVHEEIDGVLRFYSIPTTWVQPLHRDGLFSHFKIADPADPTSAASSDEKNVLDRSQVSFAHFPDPSDPRSALAPSAAQNLAIRIDDKIQTSQDAFFDNGHFPSVIITVGKNPFGDNPNGNRSRLNGKQRRQVFAAIDRVMGGVENYGQPAIIDGLIERIDRLSATSNEMGWDKSEDKTKARILSSFCVHPYILGEPVSVGGYAQAAKIEERFCKRVNTNLDLLGTTIDHFSSHQDDDRGRVMAWWEACEPHDPALRSREMIEGRKNGDVTQNEFRAHLGLPPDEDRNEREIDHKLLNGVRGILQDVGNGLISRNQAASVLRALGMSDDRADEIAGVGAPEETIDEAIEALDRAVATLRVDPNDVAGRLLEMAR